MKKSNKEKKYKDFGQWLYELRKENGYSEIELAEKINLPQIQERNIRKWERDLEYPDINCIYKLSEIYFIPSEELLYSKQMTLKEGIDGIHKWIIRWISFIMGMSIYGTIWFCRILLTVVLILVTLWFYFLTASVRVQI